MKKKILFIVNPHAGKGTIKRKLPRIVKNFFKQGYDVETCYTQKNYGPDKIIKEHKGNIALLICCGGDGTLNEVINAIMKLEKKPDISFIPLGTMNDFARTIKMSTNKFFLSKNINDSKRVPSDIGSFNEVYFNYVAAFGALTPVPYVTTQKLKRIMGKLAYFVVAFKYLFKIKSVKMRVEVNGKVIEDEFIFGSISNSKYIGSIDWFKRGDVKVDDGKFEVMFIRKPKNILEIFDMSFALLFKVYNRKYFSYCQSKEVHIQASQNIAWTLDGEYGRRSREITIKNNSKQITYIIPK